MYKLHQNKGVLPCPRPKRKLKAKRQTRGHITDFHHHHRFMFITKYFTTPLQFGQHVEALQRYCYLTFISNIFFHRICVDMYKHLRMLYEIRQIVFYCTKIFIAFLYIHIEGGFHRVEFFCFIWEKSNGILVNSYIALFQINSFAPWIDTLGG